MKSKILALSLVISLFLNAAGIVFFILFLGTQEKLRGAGAKKHQMEHYLDALALAELSRQSVPEERIQRRSFVSHADGRADSFALIAPAAPEKNYSLVVYLHGMGSTYLEPFVAPHGDPIAERIIGHDPSVAFMSCSYRDGASWGNNKALADITQNIQEVRAQYPIIKIILMGTSMGGCTSLIYAELAPPGIKELIAGVVSVESAGDLAELYQEFRGKAIANALVCALGGTPEQVPQQYHNRCFIQNLDQLPKHVRIAEVSAKDDDIVPPHFQHEIVDALQLQQYPVQLIEVEGGHGAPPSDIYARGFDYVMAGG